MDVKWLNATIANGGSSQPATTARQNERQWHGEFVLPMQLLAKLSVKTIMKDAWQCHYSQQGSS